MMLANDLQLRIGVVQSLQQLIRKRQVCCRAILPGAKADIVERRHGEPFSGAATQVQAPHHLLVDCSSPGHEQSVESHLVHVSIEDAVLVIPLRPAERTRLEPKAPLAREYMGAIGMTARDQGIAALAFIGGSHSQPSSPASGG